MFSAIWTFTIGCSALVWPAASPYAAFKATFSGPATRLTATQAIKSTPASTVPALAS
jgi:hypothetical protein